MAKNIIPTRSSKKQLILWLHRETEMARLCYGKTEVHFGNYWDFHAGCNGPLLWFGEMKGNKPVEVDFSKEWTDDIRRPQAVADMVAKHLGVPWVEKIRKTAFAC